VFNREYQKRATRQGLAQRGGGHQVAADAALRLPWAGIFEPWRPFVLTAAAAAACEPNRSENAFQRRNAAKRCKKSAQRLLFDGKLRGVQLALFPDEPVTSVTFKLQPNPVQKPRRSPADSDFPALSAMVDPMAQEILSEDELATEFEKLFS
jgi:hypothetical protein